MIDVRARGLANLHAALMTLFVGAIFWAWAYVNLNYHVPFIHMNVYENLLPYFLCVVGGMALSAREVSRRLAARFHLPDFGGSARLASRQVALMAMLLFAMMFATQDHSISRLFLGTFLVWCWLGLALLNAWAPGRLARFVFQKGHRLPTVFIGKPGSFEKVREWSANKEPLGIYPVGVLSPEPPPPGPGGLAVPWLGTSADLPRVLEEKLVGQVIMLELPVDDDEASRVITACRDRGCRLLIHSNIEERYSQPLVPITEEGRHFYTLQEEPLEDPLNRLVKRSFDLRSPCPSSCSSCRPCAPGCPSCSGFRRRAPFSTPGSAGESRAIPSACSSSVRCTPSGPTKPPSRSRRSPRTSASFRLDDS